MLGQPLAPADGHVARVVEPVVAAVRAAVAAQALAAYARRIAHVVDGNDVILAHDLPRAAGRAYHMILAQLVHGGQIAPDGGLLPADGFAHPHDLAGIGVGSGALLKIREGIALTRNGAVQAFLVQKEVFDADGGAIRGGHHRRNIDGAVGEKYLARPDAAQLAARGPGTPQQRLELGLHHLAGAVVIRHGQHAGAGATIHSVSQAGVQGQFCRSGARRRQEPPPRAALPTRP